MRFSVSAKIILVTTGFLSILLLLFLVVPVRSRARQEIQRVEDYVEESRKLLASESLDRQQLQTVLEAYQHTTTEHLRGIRFMQVMGSFGVVFVFYAVQIFVMKMLVILPIFRIVQDAQAVIDGNSESPSKIVLPQRDEFGILAEKLNEMLTTLHTRYAHEDSSSNSVIAADES